VALEAGSWREVTEVCLDMITSVASTRSPFTSSLVRPAWLVALTVLVDFVILHAERSIGGKCRVT